MITCALFKCSMDFDKPTVGSLKAIADDKRTRVCKNTHKRILVGVDHFSSLVAISLTILINCIQNNELEIINRPGPEVIKLS